MTIFFDNCVPPPLGRALRELKRDVRILQEEFKSPGVLDTEWMPVVERHDWIVLTEDNKIRRRQVERAMLKDSKLRMIFLPEAFGRAQLWDKVVNLMQWWPDIEEACGNLAPATRLLMKTKKGRMKMEVLERL